MWKELTEYSHYLVQRIPAPLFNRHRVISYLSLLALLTKASPQKVLFSQPIDEVNKSMLNILSRINIFLPKLALQSDIGTKFNFFFVGFGAQHQILNLI